MRFQSLTLPRARFMATQVLDKRDEPLDCVVRLVTPERIIVVHPLAGPFRRFAAY